MCAGIRIVAHSLGAPVHSSNWKLPSGNELNMDEAFGLVLQKAVPLSAMANPRLHPRAYKG